MRCSMLRIDFNHRRKELARADLNFKGVATWRQIAGQLEVDLVSWRDRVDAQYGNAFECSAGDSGMDRAGCVHLFERDFENAGRDAIQLRKIDAIRDRNQTRDQGSGWDNSGRSRAA